MVGSNPWKSFIRLISLEGIFQSLQPKSKFQTQEMRKVSLPQAEIADRSSEREQRRVQMRLQYEQLAQRQILIEAEIEAERINH